MRHRVLIPYTRFIIAAGGGKAVAVDPYDVPQIAAAAEKEGLEFIGLLTTHHHDDHSGGNKVCERHLADSLLSHAFSLLLGIRTCCHKRWGDVLNVHEGRAFPGASLWRLLAGQCAYRPGQGICHATSVV